MGRMSMAIPDELKQALQEKASSMNISLSAYIRIVLSESVQDKK